MDERENPIVAMAQRLRARRDVGAAIDSATADAPAPRGDDAASRFAALAAALATGTKRLNSILGPRNGVTFVRLENPLRLRLRFRDRRIALDLDAGRQLVLVAGAGLDGEYQFIDAETPALMNLSKFSTDAGYRDAVTASELLKTIAEDAQLPRPAHLDAPGPLF
ncbi:MAG TPA: hypothetical protein VHT53_13860 [Candidatus Elarobacter sp.]|jgi:hypothetical protein|nr:hypothetical protein [Candidatus Elarobacter sp.]